MEASSSSNTANLMIESVVDNKTKISFDSVGGRKSEEIVAELVEVSSDEVSSDDLSLEDEEDYDVEEDSDEEDSDEEEEEDEEDNERTRILEDMWKLKKFAEFFQHPEKDVEVDGFAAGRSYFSRPDAADALSEDEDEERADALADAQALKQVAAAYLHPERPVVVDATACARNYFSQPWASEQETFGQAEERARLVEQSRELKDRAFTYRHPEAPIDLEPATSMARNYFLRASGPEQVDEEEQALVMEEMKALKRLAVDYMHPEKALEVDAAACARNYFSRASAPEQEEDEYADEREVILEEMKELKEAAATFMHPERPLEIDATACARSYFDRPSAPEQDDEQERELILQEMQALKKLAVDYRHPEVPVEIDAAARGRNYFTRPSASEQMDGEEEAILQEMKALKSLAIDYRHPERPLEVDTTASARNYFSRASAPEQEEDEYADEREVILEEMKELKEAATTFMHPERPLEIDVTASARSYFDRPSAPEQDEEERELIWQEMQALKKLAVDYRHPELPVEIDAAARGRNYFTRPSAPEQEEDEYTDDREIVLEEMKELKQLASDYRHPEKPVEVDAAAFGRNYFSRPSAPEQDDEENDEERQMILKEVALLKQKAVDFMHPECPVVVDPTAFGRNYYGRASAPDQESFAEAEERASIMADAKGLKSGAELYLHPEKPLEVDGTVGGRNYFSRPSAESDSESDDEERALVLKEAQELKKLASAYMHPEKPLSVDPAVFGRNYFGRASAPGGESFDEAEERSRVLAEAESLKKHAVTYAHPELPVATTDAAVFGRNYFSRPSAPEQEAPEEAEERAQVLAEASALKKLAVDYLHPELSVKTSDPAALGRNYFVRGSAPGASEHISSSGYANAYEPKADEHSHHDDYGHFEMDEEIFYDMRQSIVLPMGGANAGPKVQSSKMSSEEEGELSRSPSSVMLFTGALEDADHPPLPSMG